MPLTKNVGKNIKELNKDNKKKGKAKGANGKVRSKKQILAIALNAAGKKKIQQTSDGYMKLNWKNKPTSPSNFQS
jgi:hypothetical protein